MGALRAHCRDMYLALDARVGPLCGARCVGVGRREPEEFHSFIHAGRVNAQLAPPVEIFRPP